MSFSYKYGLVFLAVLLVEVLIALYVHDRLVRPFVGDVLVIVLIYSFIKTFLNAKPMTVALGVLIFAVVVEISQYFNLAEMLEIEQYKLAKIALGSTFDPYDLLAYQLGFGIVVIVEAKRKSKSAS